MRKRSLWTVAAVLFAVLVAGASLWLNGFFPWLTRPLPWTAYAWASAGVLIDLLTVVTFLGLATALFFFARRVHSGSPT